MEALNDGMLKVFKNIGRYSDDKGEFFNWVYTIVRNTALDKLKINGGPRHVEVDDIDIPDNDNPLTALESSDIYKLLDVLPPATRAICILFYLEGCQIPEIAEQLELSAGTVKWHLSEVRKRLKPVLLQYYKK